MAGHECGRYRPSPAYPGPEICLSACCGASAGFFASSTEPSAAQPAGTAHAAGASPTAAPCRRLATAIQRPASWRARPSAAERRSFPLPAAHATAATAAATEIFLESSAAEAGTHTAPAEPQRDMATPDAGAEAASVAGSPPDADASSRPAAHGEKRDPRSASHASRAARAGHRFGSLQEQFLSPGPLNPARRYPSAAGACGRRRGSTSAGVAALGSEL